MRLDPSADPSALPPNSNASLGVQRGAEVVNVKVLAGERKRPANDGR